VSPSPGPRSEQSSPGTASKNGRLRTLRIDKLSANRHPGLGTLMSDSRDQFCMIREQLHPDLMTNDEKRTTKHCTVPRETFRGLQADASPLMLSLGDL
jgi:hypothetical protein